MERRCDWSGCRKQAVGVLLRPRKTSRYWQPHPSWLARALYLCEEHGAYMDADTKRGRKWRVLT